MEMEKVWHKLEGTINYLDDNYTYGAAEMLFIGSIGACFALFIYCVLAAATYGYIQLFNLISGSF
jgi:hypothetical protein